MLHYVKNISINENIPENLEEIVFGAGCFWGVEKKFWNLSGVYVTSVGYSGGSIDNPTYEDVCYKDTGHVELCVLHLLNFYFGFVFLIYYQSPAYLLF